MPRLNECQVTIGTTLLFLHIGFCFFEASGFRLEKRVKTVVMVANSPQFRTPGAPYLANLASPS